MTTFARDAIAAWEEYYPHPGARWNSIPARVRRSASEPRLGSLRAAVPTRSLDAGTAPGTQEAWWERILFGGGCAIGVVWLVAMVAIGMWMVWPWIWG